MEKRDYLDQYKRALAARSAEQRSTSGGDDEKTDHHKVYALQGLPKPSQVQGHG